MNKKSLEDLRAFLEQTQTSMSAVAETAPEAFKGIFADLKGKAEAALRGMPLIDAVPAALDLSGTLRYCESMINQLTDCCGNLAKSLSAKTAEATSLCTDMAAFKARLAAGELLEKSAVETLAQSARAAGAESARREMALMTARRSSLSSLGLTEAPEEALAGEDPVFEARAKAAAERAKLLAEKGVSLSGAHAKRMLWAEAKDWERDFALVQEFAGAAKPAATPAKQPEPVLGGGAAAGFTGAV